MRLCLQVLCAGIAATLVNAVSLTVEDPTPKALRGASTADVTVDTNRNLATTDVHTETSSENHVSATPKVKKVRENRLWSDDDDSDILSDDFSIDYSDDISDDYSYDSKEGVYYRRTYHHEPHYYHNHLHPELHSYSHYSYHHVPDANY